MLRLQAPVMALLDTRRLSGVADNGGSLPGEQDFSSRPWHAAGRDSGNERGCVYREAGMRDDDDDVVLLDFCCGQSQCFESTM